jgi:hypothetical protein
MMSNNFIKKKRITARLLKVIKTTNHKQNTQDKHRKLILTTVKQRDSEKHIIIVKIITVLIVCLVV